MDALRRIREDTAVRRAALFENAAVPPPPPPRRPRARAGPAASDSLWSSRHRARVLREDSGRCAEDQGRRPNVALVRRRQLRARVGRREAALAQLQLSDPHPDPHPPHWTPTPPHPPHLQALAQLPSLPARRAHLNADPTTLELMNKIFREKKPRENSLSGGRGSNTKCRRSTAAPGSSPHTHTHLPPLLAGGSRAHGGAADPGAVGADRVYVEYDRSGRGGRPGEGDRQVVTSRTCHAQPHRRVGLLLRPRHFPVGVRRRPLDDEATRTRTGAAGPRARRPRRRAL